MSPEFPPFSVLRVLHSTLGASENGPSDAELLTRFIEGNDAGAFEFLIWRHGGMVHGVCRSILKDHHMSEDAVQAVFLALARCGRSISDRNAVSGWLYRVARRVANKADLRRKNKHESELVSADVAADVTAASPCDSSDQHAILRDEIDRLSEKYRTALVLCYFEGLSHTAAAKRLGCPVGTLNTRVDRAKRKLADRLSKRGVVLPAGGIASLLVGRFSTDLRADLIDLIARSGAAFAAGSRTIPGVAPTVIASAREAARAIVLPGLFRTFGLLATLAFSGLALIAFLSSRGDKLPDSASTSGFATNVATISEHKILAPTPRKEEIDEKTIAAFQNAGATYGGFIPLDEKDVSWTVNSLEFREGANQAERGLPGFRFDDPPKSALPAIERDFGIELRLLPPKHPNAVVDADLIEAVRGMKRVRAMNLICGKLTDGAYKELGRMKQLRSLLLQLETSEPDDRALAELSALTNLESLMLSGNGLTDEAIGSILKFTKLRRLQIQDCRKITDSGIARLSALEELDTLSLASRPTAKTLAKFKRLEVLTLAAKDLRDGDLRGLAELKKLRVLGLRSDRLSDGCIRILSELENLKSLNIISRNMSENAEEELRKRLPKCRIKIND